MLNHKEIEQARCDFAELRKLVKGKTIPELVTEIRADKSHPIGICNILDWDHLPTGDISEAMIVDVNYKSLNPAIYRDERGLCSIDKGNSRVDVFSWHDKETADEPVGALTYDEITGPASILTDEQLTLYCETVADIAYDCGARRLRISNDSRVRIKTIVSWAKEFNDLHRDTDWEVTDYILTVEEFIDSKLAEHQFPLDYPCPICGSKSLLYENIGGNDDYRSVVCTGCGRIVEDDDARKLILEAMREIYEDRIFEKGFQMDLIRRYLDETLTLTDKVMTEEEVVDDFEHWNEQSELAFEKIQDANHYSRL
jgi:hypothetical protein